MKDSKQRSKSKANEARPPKTAMGSKGPSRAALATGKQTRGTSRLGDKHAAGAILDKAAPPLTRRPTPSEIALQESMGRFESALQLLSRNQFAKARPILERLTDNPARDLAERARMYLSVCEQRLQRPSPQFKTAEELYDYGVRLANQGNPQEAEEQLRKALKLSPQADYVYYALATTYAQREDIEGTLENLLKAISLNERNRYQAQNDADFANLLEDPRFTELLYPEKPV